MILPALLLTLDEYSSWRVGRVVPMIRSAVRTTLCSLLRSDLVAELNQTVIEVQRMDSMMAEYNCFSSSCGRLNFLRWRRKYCRLHDDVILELMLTQKIIRDTDQSYTFWPGNMSNICRWIHLECIHTPRQDW